MREVFLQLTNVAPVQEPPIARVRIVAPDLLSDISEGSERSSDVEGSVRGTPEDEALDSEVSEED